MRAKPRFPIACLLFRVLDRTAAALPRWEVSEWVLIPPGYRGNCNSDSLVTTGLELCRKQRVS